MTDTDEVAPEAEAEPEFAIVAQGNMELLRDVQRALQQNGLRSTMVQPPPGSDPSGTIFLLAVATKDGMDAARVVHELWGRDLDPDAVDAASQTIDLDANDASCPACGASFTPADLRCPECGLRFG